MRLLVILTLSCVLFVPLPTAAQTATLGVGRERDASPQILVRRPVAITALADGSKAFIAFQNDGSLDVIDLALGSVTKRLRVGPPAGEFHQVPVHLALDPEERHLFITNARSNFVTVVDAVTDQVVRRLSAPRGCQRTAFHFAGGTRRVYVTNDRDDAVLVFDESPMGNFTRLADIPLQGLDPRPIAVNPTGLLLVGNRGTHEIEVLDPSLALGFQTIARRSLGSLPLDIVLAGGAYLVPTFTPISSGPRDGTNEVLRLNLTTHQIVARFLADFGTDYLDLDRSGPFVAVASAGSGSVLVADAATGALLQRIALTAGGVPLAVPTSLALTAAPGGSAIERLLVVSTFRETLRSIDLSSGPPFTTAFELVLSSTGRPRIPLRDLTEAEDGEWLFRSSAFFQGTITAPNPGTCATCHPGGGADGLIQQPTARQVPSLFRSHETEPLGWQGQLPVLNANQIRGTFNTHGIVAGAPPAAAENKIIAFLTEANNPPPSPYRLANGGLSSDAILGRGLFLGSAGCASCHAAPLFIPSGANPLTITLGVGTGLAPANVPSLRGVWSSAPYLHDGSMLTLRDVLVQNPGNLHGTTSQLTAQELDRLVAYLRSL